MEWKKHQSGTMQPAHKIHKTHGTFDSDHTSHWLEIPWRWQSDWILLSAEDASGDRRTHQFIHLEFEGEINPLLMEYVFCFIRMYNHEGADWTEKCLATSKLGGFLRNILLAWWLYPLFFHIPSYSGNSLPFSNDDAGTMTGRKSGAGNLWLTMKKGEVISVGDERDEWCYQTRNCPC